MNIVVIGSLNMDTTLVTKNLPKRGETIFAFDLYHSFGGKGANQAVSSSRLGGNVDMIGCVGDDANGHSYIKKLNEEGIHTDNIKCSDEKPTGIASITVEEGGSNMIIVYPGANLTLRPSDIDDVWEHIKDKDLIIVQFEIPMETVFHIGQRAKMSNIKFLVNPAPANSFSHGFAETIDYLTPNQTELELLSGEKDIDLAANKLLDFGVKNVVVTLGSSGSCWYTKDEKISVDAFKCDAIDTTAAGDCFNGAFAVALCSMHDKKDILRFANAAAGLSTTKTGAIDSLPSLEEVQQFLEDNQ